MKQRQPPKSKPKEANNHKCVKCGKPADIRQGEEYFCYDHCAYTRSSL